jgi:hypothetical protein
MAMKTRTPVKPTNENPWTITAQTTEEADMIALMKRIGVLPHEVDRHPEGGIIVSHTAVRKLADHSPNRQAAAKLMEYVAAVMRRHIKVVQ